MFHPREPCKKGHGSIQSDNKQTRPDTEGSIRLIQRSPPARTMTSSIVAFFEESTKVDLKVRRFCLLS